MPFEKGKSGNPNGRPLGSRHELGESFLRDFKEVWVNHGKAALITVAEENPTKFCELAAGLLPREAKLDVSGTVNHQSEPVSTLDSFIRQALSKSEMGTDEKPVSH